MPPPTYQDIEALVARGEWQEATAVARRVGSDALAEGRFALARNTGGILERLKDYRYSAHLRSISMRELEGPCALPEWDGSDLSGRTLLVVSRNDHVAPATLRLGRLLPIAASRAQRCMALIEPRLVPLFQRSFPSIEIREAGLANAEAYAQADVVASYETLIEHIGVREDGGITALPALKPDPDQVAAFRSKYQSSNSLIGICWHSTNTSKDVPTVGEWADFLHKLNATFISTQYGDVKGDIETLRRLSGMQIIYDDSVDSLKNLDLFAAQVSVLDAMVTISNTGAHMAGALGIPTFVLLDDKDQLAWPFVGHSTGWYVSARLYRKAGRRWGDVFEDVSEDVTLAV